MAIVRISGPLVLQLATRMVRSRSPLRPRYAANADILDERGETLDRGLAIFFRAPHSYTGEDVLELHLHGSPVIARETVRAAIACGARLAQPGEFTRRALLNGKMDLHAAAAVAEIIEAETRSAARAALANLGGGLATLVGELRAELARALESLSAAIDFPEEVPDPDVARLDGDLARIAARLQELRHDGEVGRLLREGVGVAIVGAPNAGKSSLLNALLGEERALVSEIAGTTRDTIEERLTIDGVPVRLVDTAGIRAHADRLEAMGVERTHRTLEAARIALVVIDGSQPLGAEARAVLERTRERERILFFNKADLGEHPQIAALRSRIDRATVSGSVRWPQTLAELRRGIARLGWGGERIDVERPHIASLREFDAIDRALAGLQAARASLRAGDPPDLCAGDLQRAFSALGHVTERIAAEEVLDGVFSRFCIGK